MARKPDKRSSILDVIRQRIVSGQLEPGVRLPPRRDFEQEFASSPTTMQQVFDRLRREGFISVKGRHATYVAEHPPHQVRYAIAFPTSPHNDPAIWPRSWNAMTSAAAALQNAPERQIELFFDIRPGSEHPHRREMLAALREQRLAGLVLANRPLEQFGLERQLHETPVPVVLTYPEPGPQAVAPLVIRDYESFFARALDYLARRGCRRVAIFLTPERQHLHGPLLDRALATRGMISPPYWRQIVHPAALDAARLNVQLLLAAEQSQHPEGLIIADDNLIMPVKAGLLASGRNGPLQIVAHCAFPATAHVDVSMIRLGFDARQVLQRCLQCIEARRRGESVSATSIVKPVFEEEIGALVSQATDPVEL